MEQFYSELERILAITINGITSEGFLLQLGGTLVGALIAFYFARKGSGELITEAQRLRKLNHFTFRILAKAGYVETIPDPETKQIKGYRIEDDSGGEVVFDDEEFLHIRRHRATSVDPGDK